MFSKAFQKAVSHKKLIGAFLSCALVAAALSSCNNGTQTSTDTSFEEILPHLPKQATPLNYSPDNLKKQAASVTTSQDNAPETFVLTPARLHKIQRAKESLGEICPSAQRKPIKDFTNWFQNIPANDLKAAPTVFLDRSFHTIALLPPTDEKYESLTALLKFIPDSETLTLYAQKKRVEVQEFLNRDPDVAQARAQWPNMSGEEKNIFLQKLSKQTLDILLPNKEIVYPKVILIHGKGSRFAKGRLGFYESSTNEIYLNGVTRPILWDSNRAMSILIHETFHAYQLMLANWQNKGFLKRFPDVERQALFYKLNIKKDTAAIRYEQNQTGYLLSALERGAWAFQMAAEPNYKLGSFKYDQFNPFQIDSSGKLIHKHLVEKVPDIKLKGKIPKICFE